MGVSCDCTGSMAEEATASQTIRTLIDKAHSLASSSDPFHDDQTRVALLGLSQQLAGLLMQPDEAVAHLAHGVRLSRRSRPFQVLTGDFRAVATCAYE